jgi:hypothetical protein
MEAYRNTCNDDNTRLCPPGGDNLSKAVNRRSNGNIEGNGDSRFSTNETITNKVVIEESLLVS